MTLKKTMKALTAMICLTLIMTSIIPVSAAAENTSRKTVRVGWYDSSFCRIDNNGRRSGYAYEYQQKIATYVDLEYEYVEGSWFELFEMLKSGEIDLMSDIFYTEERSSQMLFPDLPMGAESYYVFVSADNPDFHAGNTSYFDGKKSE